MQTVKLSEKTEIPILGFGTWQIQGEVCTKAVLSALEVGYRHIDTAEHYENHKAIKKALEGSGVDRKELFITSKLWMDYYHKDDVASECERALFELGVEYLDLYLMHWPDRKVPWSETISALEDLKSKGLIREWGVSNCTIHHLQDIMNAGFHPVNNQVEFHPSLNQKELKDFCDKNNVTVTAYSPIAQGADLKLDVIQKLSEKYNRSTSQVVLNWLISKNITVVPKASTLEHIQDNFKVLEWRLEPEDIALIDQLNTDYRVVYPPFQDFDY